MKLRWTVQYEDNSVPYCESFRNYGDAVTLAKSKGVDFVIDNFKHTHKRTPC